jgi:DNA replication protein DnaC
MAGQDPHDKTTEATTSPHPATEPRQGRAPLRPAHEGRDLVALNRREPSVSHMPPAPDASTMDASTMDASTMDASTPDADALDPDRILELPMRRAAAPPEVRQLDDEETPQPARIARLIPALPRAPSRIHLLPASAERASRPMVALREAAQPYLTRLAARRGSEDARPTDGGSGDLQNEQDGQARGPRTRSPGKRQESVVAPPVCPLCNGAGFVRLDAPVGDPQFGKAILCECKAREIEERERQKLRDLSSLKPFEKKTFEMFETTDPRAAGAREAYDVARRYADDPHGWLILQGGYGCGKTHLAAAIARQREVAGDTVLFSIVPDLLDHLRAAFAPTSEITYDALFDRIREAGLLVLDDLGSENATAWATEKLFQIINYRYNYRLPTVITTNVRLLSHMDDRIRSRLGDLGLVRWVVIDAPDYRERHVGPGGNNHPPRRTGPRGRG